MSNSLKNYRIESIDLLRGIVMVIMALDHTRDYFHFGAMSGANLPENLETTTAFLFFTRFITHFCAPVFVFLAGTSARLYGNKTSHKNLSTFLLSRGLWLVFIEAVVVNFAWWFDIDFEYINLQVIWAIGISMICLSALIYLPKKVLLALSLLIIFGHNALDSIVMKGDDFTAIFWYFLHQGKWIKVFGDHYIGFAYPVLPWIGLMSLGYIFGQYYSAEYDAEKRKTLFRKIGFAAIALFFVLRLTNLYGDANIWASQDTVTKTMLSFFKLEKYPPSLHFFLITLGPALLFLAYAEKLKSKVTDFFLVFGRVPFLYYILHLYLIHIFATIGVWLTGKNPKHMIMNNEMYATDFLANYGYDLWVTYLMWILIVVILYFPCKKYMVYKAENKDKKWLSYL